jgi:DNA-binding CsgD family transcriptional regulator
MNKPTGEIGGRQLRRLQGEIMSLHEAEIDLDKFPEAIFRTMHALIDADFMGYGELPKGSGAFRGLCSQMPSGMLQTMGRWSPSTEGHSLWTGDPLLYGSSALMESDFFSLRQFRNKAIYSEVFRPLSIQRFMSISIPAGPAFVVPVCYRSGRGFTERERQILQQLRRHFHSLYLLAYQRSVAKLDSQVRLRLAFPSLTERQLEAGAWLIAGKSNETIGRLMNLSLEGVKFHLRAIFDKLGVDDRLAAALVLATTRPDFIPSSAAFT